MTCTPDLPTESESNFDGTFRNLYDLGQLLRPLLFSTKTKTGMSIQLPNPPQQDERHTSDLDEKSDLKDQIVILKASIGDFDDRHSPSSSRILLSRVINEIETWINGDGETALEYDAQLALIYASGSEVAEFGQSDYDAEGDRQPLEAYLSILKSMHAANGFVEEEREILSIAISDCDEYLNTPINATTTLNHHAELDILHSICDNYVARHSVDLAMKVVKDARKAKIIEDLFQNLQKNTIARDLTKKGVAAMERFERFGHVKDLEQGLEHLSEAVVLTPYGSPNRPDVLNNFGLSLMRRFERFGEVKDIDAAIERQTESVTITPLESPDRPGGLNNLGLSLMRRFERFGEVKDIDAAIERQTESVTLTPLDSPNRPGELNNLGLSLMRRFERFGEMKDADAAIQRLTEAVNLVPLDSPHHPIWLGNLGTSLMRRFERLGEVKDLDAAIGRQTEAVNLIPIDNPHHSMELDNLGISLMRRFERFGDLKGIDTAIGRQTEALDLTPLDNPNRSMCLNNLGLSLLRRYERFAEVKDIDASIERQTEALDLTPLDSPNRYVWLNNLGISLMHRFERSGEVQDIDAAIERQTEALDLTPLDSPNRSMWLNNLGLSLMRRFERSGEVQDIDAAIGRQTEALDFIPLDNPNRPTQLNNLGISLGRRFERFGEVKDIDAAIGRQTEAVDLVPIDSPYRPEVLNNLGLSLMHRFQLFGDIMDLHRASDALRSSYISPSGFPIRRLQAALQYADILHSQKDFSSASEYYDSTAHLLPQTVWIGLDAVSQLNQLTSYIQSFGSDAAACMISMAELEPGHEQQHLGRAVEILDQTRSILWSQTSKPRQNLQDLKEVDPQLAQELDNVGGILRKGSFRDSSTPMTELEQQQYRRSAERWEELVLEVRKLPSFEHFLLPLPISKLREAANGGPVVIINVSNYRIDALIIPPSGNLELLPLSFDIAAPIKGPAEKQHKTLISGRSRDGHFWDDISNTQDESVLEILYLTWTLLGEPIVSKLETCGLLDSNSTLPPRIWWYLTGDATFVPIHVCLPRPVADSVQPKGMMDLVVSSYTPTLSTLARAQRHQPRSESIRMLAIGQPESQDRPTLSFVGEEIELIRGLLRDKATFFENSNATVDAVSAALPKYTWVHFACHGIQDHDNPLESGLLLYNDRLLTLSRLAQCHLEGAEFAFLSSCESATGSKFKPNESVHLAAGLQFVGFRGVIGTMWSVEDKDALNVAKTVYEELFKDGAEQAKASDAAVALHRAVRRLRDEEKAPVNRWVPFIHFGF